MTGPQAAATEGPEAYNPVLEAISALEALGEMEGLMIGPGRSSPEVQVYFHGARAIAWALLASVSGGQSIALKPVDGSGEEGPGPLEQAAKKAFHG